MVLKIFPRLWSTGICDAILFSYCNCLNTNILFLLPKPSIIQLKLDLAHQRTDTNLYLPERQFISKPLFDHEEGVQI